MLRFELFGLQVKRPYLIKQSWFVRRWRRNPTSACWCEAEFGSNRHHDFRLAISDRDVRRLDWIASRRFDHGAVFLDCLGRLRPKTVILYEKSPVSLPVVIDS